jgi:PAS domain-containing protein
MGTIAAATLVLASVISESKRSDQRLQVQEAVNRLLAESPTLKEAVPHILQVLCERARWDWGALWNIDRSANELRCVESVASSRLYRRHCFRPTPNNAAFLSESVYRAEFGAPARQLGSPTLPRTAISPRAPLAIKDGLHGAFGFPIKLGGRDSRRQRMLQSRGSRTGRSFPPDGSAILAGRSANSWSANGLKDDLRTQRFQLRACVTDITPVLLTQCSRDLRYTYVNRAYAAMLGLTPVQIIGRPILEIIGAEGFAAIRPYVGHRTAGAARRIRSGDFLTSELAVVFVRVFLHA